MPADPRAFAAVVTNMRARFRRIDTAPGPSMARPVSDNALARLTSWGPSGGPSREPTQGTPGCDRLRQEIPRPPAAS
jgi:hypothetical protein